ncbi:MAG: nitrous oxide reductase accessory protein NosL [Thermus sp.]|uniref:nitrous oxide reductase accessory protein NosL n=1 Tax=unclassified Thermus TaxID=2619321 RepID=UPI000543A82D|nr:nitrous oxide reductase accessory protein NosL [Thermus sp. 2.9]KHG64427.1 Tat pathway signal protein [Thermus sp. 2.9]
MRNRREVLQVLGGLVLAAPALAQHGGMAEVGQEGSKPMGALVPPKSIPWDTGQCSFCGMPLKTPEGQWRGRTFPKGFFEQTYSQIAFAQSRPAPHDPKEVVDALHFESIACMVNYAWVHGLRDGEGATFYVVDRGAYDPAHPQETVRLIPARAATYYWGERMMVVMNARLLAFGSARAAQEFAETNKGQHGRQRFYSFQTLWDLAPLPEMNLVALLAKHAGLLGQGQGDAHHH